MSASLSETQGIRLAVEGCGHGTLDAIYASITKSCEVRGWDGIDLLIIGGDFQAVRNGNDLEVMSVPVKYREMGDFHAYYSGEKKAPYLTIFIGGNHEAASHLWELYYGGWAAPNIYYLGAANVVRFGPLRIAALSGIWKGFDYKKPHIERLPFNQDDVKSFYHVREIDVRKLLQLKTQVDVGLSHDWPREIEKFGDSRWLFGKKSDFRQESDDGTLGSVAAKLVMDRLRPPHWFSAHLHIKYAAIKHYEDNKGDDKAVQQPEQQAETAVVKDINPDEIDLDMDDDDDDDAEVTKEEQKTEEVSEEMRAQLPASFAKPQRPKHQVQSVPDTIPNKTVRFLALDKCLPGRHFLQLVDCQPYDSNDLITYPVSSEGPRFRLQYDPEWLAITRVFHKDIQIGDRNAQNPPDMGEDVYAPQVDTQMQWVEENIVSRSKLDIPYNFEITAPIHDGLNHVPGQPYEYTSPQTDTFCKLLEVPNMWDDRQEARDERRAMGPAPAQQRFDSRGGHRGGGGGRGRGGRGGRGRGRGRGHGGRR